MKAHPRQPRGGRSTDQNDYPQEKTAYALRDADAIVRKARELGPNVEHFAKELFAVPFPWSKLRAGQRLLGFGEKYGAQRLDATCEHSLSFELVDVARLGRMLHRAIEPQQPASPEAGPPLGSRHARPPSAFDRRQMALAEATR